MNNGFLSKFEVGVDAVDFVWVFEFFEKFPVFGNRSLEVFQSFKVCVEVGGFQVADGCFNFSAEHVKNFA